jgi:hypothetical protein
MQTGAVDASIVSLGCAVAVAACGSGASGANSATNGAGAASSSATPAATTSSSTGAAAGGGGGSSSTTGSGGASGGAGGAASCDGYEPCGVNPVQAPAGYTIEAAPGVSVQNGATTTSCTAFADCDMWNTHYTPVWMSCSGCGKIDNGWNRMSSPFPIENSRYIFQISPKTIQYVAFHMTAPGELYVYGDGTKEMHTDPDTGVTSCFQRGAGHIESALIDDLGGTGDVGIVDWNISLLPGDMGNTGNSSTCSGSGGTTAVLITSDPMKAATTKNSAGKYSYCLLREGQDYYLNFMSSGSVPAVDCSTDPCTMGGFVFANPVTSDGNAVVDQVPCN